MQLRRKAELSAQRLRIEVCLGPRRYLNLFEYLRLVNHVEMLVQVVSGLDSGRFFAAPLNAPILASVLLFCDELSKLRDRD